MARRKWRSGRPCRAPAALAAVSLALALAPAAGCSWEAPAAPAAAAADGRAAQARLSASLLSGTPPVGYPVGADLGGQITYVGLDADPVPVEPGEPLVLSHVFEVRDIVFDWDLFVHVEPAGGGRVLADHVPVGGLLPTSLWKRGQIIRDTHSVGMPEDLAGSVRVLVGFFRGSKRLEVLSGLHDADGRVVAADLPVSAGPVLFPPPPACVP